MKTAWWKNFLFVPDLDESEHELYRRWLLIILPVALALLIIYCAVALRSPANRDALIFIGIFALLLPGLYFLAWRGQVNATSAILSLGSFVGLLAATIRFGGVRSASYPTVLVSILLASMFLRARVAVTMGLVAIAAGVILLIGETAGWYQPDFVIASPFSTWFNLTLLFGVCATLLGLAGRNIRTVLFNHRLEIRERQRAEIKLRESQEQLNLALQAAKMGLWSWNIASDSITWSKEVYRVFGLQPEEFDGSFEAYLNAIHPADRERVTKKIAEALHAETEEYSIEHRLLLKDGKIRWLEGRGRVARDANGSPLHMAGTVWDITENKRAEQALRRADVSLERNATALQRRSTLLQVGAEVSRAASAILDSNLLSQQVVKLIKTRFNLYYVGLFLVDESNQWAILQAATGREGRKMLAHHHRLEVGETSMVGWAIAHRQARIALDVGAEAVRFSNPMLPETRSEIALPLISRGEALGAISIQSAQEAAFSREDISSLQTMTDQLANALLNARFYDQLQRELQERKAIEEEIRRLNSELEERVQTRTADLRASEEKFRALTENNPLRIRRYDREGRYLYANHISGDPHFRTPDLIGRKIREVIDDPALVELAERSIQQVFESGQPLNTEYKIRDSYASWWLAPEFDAQGKVISVITSTLDITERRRMEEELRQRSADLQAANRELEAFSYSVSHDLRAPLRAIDGFSRIVSEDFAPLLPQEGRELLQRTRLAAQEMGGLIDDLLRLSRVTRAELRQESVDISALAAEICAELGFRQPERSAQFILAENLQGQGDARLLRVALENLLNNAWKFTSKNEQTRIEVGRDPAQNAFFVRDNGVGFDMAYADKLFGAFQRLHSAEDFPGTGIGLAIVQRVIHRHGGKIWAESQPNQGALFFFTLPGGTQ